jgi:hypothetical protein
MPLCDLLAPSFLFSFSFCVYTLLLHWYLCLSFSNCFIVCLANSMALTEKSVVLLGIIDFVL